MSRTSRVVLLVVLALVALRIVVTLASSPPAQPPGPAPGAPVSADGLAPELAAVDREIERLSSRMSEPSPLPVPRRDPFRFVTATPPASDAERRDLAAFDPPEPVGPAVTWPVLVAMLTSGDDVTPVYRAVFEDAAGIVHVRSPGDTLNGFRVEAVDDGVVTVVHEATGESIGLSIR